MKKIIPTVLLCLVLSFAQAQPSLTSAKMLSPGSVMKFNYSLNLDVMDTTIQGANKTWDFSALTNTTDSSYSVTIASPGNTAYGSDFPSANYAYIEYQYPDTSYSYFNLSAANMQRVGSWSGGTLTSYTDPQVEYIFPLTIGASNNDTWANTSSTFGGTYDLSCIGYGTLILPSATYSNTLMVRVWATETNFYTFPVYFWYSADNGAILCEYIVGDGFFVEPQGLYIQSMSVVGIKEDNLITNLKYNNPVVNNLMLSFTCKKSALLEYTIRNVQGESVLSKNYFVASQQAEHVEFNFSGLAPGLYFLNIKSDDPGEAVKTIKLVKM